MADGILDQLGGGYQVPGAVATPALGAAAGDMPGVLQFNPANVMNQALKQRQQMELLQSVQQMQNMQTQAQEQKQQEFMLGAPGRQAATETANIGAEAQLGVAPQVAQNTAKTAVLNSLTNMDQAKANQQLLKLHALQQAGALAVGQIQDKDARLAASQQAVKLLPPDMDMTFGGGKHNLADPQELADIAPHLANAGILTPEFLQQASLQQTKQASAERIAGGEQATQRAVAGTHAQAQVQVAQLHVQAQENPEHFMGQVLSHASTATPEEWDAYRLAAHQTSIKTAVAMTQGNPSMMALLASGQINQQAITSMFNNAVQAMDAQQEKIIQKYQGAKGGAAPTAAPTTITKDSVESAFGKDSYDPAKWDYRVGPGGKLQRKPK